MKTQIVLGTFFGDEGKGSTVQWLCKEAIDRGEKPLVIRYSGGSQAGHRIIANGIEHVCSSFGGGTLLGVPTYLNENVMIDPISTKIEFEQLQSKGITPKLYVNPFLKIITPYDVAANRSDKKVLKHGSCGEGIYHTFKRCADDYDLCVAAAALSPRHALAFVRGYYHVDVNSEWEEKFVEAMQWLKAYAETDNYCFLTEGYDTLIFEGSQGLLLDMDCGFMPHCTPSKVGLNGVPEHYLKNAEVFMVMRTYITRHGNGYNPFREDLVREYFNLDEPTNSNDGYQGIFKYGVFDQRLLRRVCDRHHLDNYQKKFDLNVNIVVTHMDCTLIDDVVPHIDISGDIEYEDTEGFTLCAKESSDLKIDKIYGSYSPELSNEQFKTLATK